MSTNLRTSQAWFPRTTEALTRREIGKCLHCGSEDLSLVDARNEISVKCWGCGTHLIGSMSLRPATIEEIERTRTMVATLWTGREVKPPLVSYNVWKSGTTFTGGKSPDWDTIPT